MQSRIVLILLFALLIFFIWNMRDFVARVRAAWENRRIAEERLKDLEDKKAALSADLAKLGTESGVEESIRLKFGLAKEGEGVIVVVPDEKKTEAEPLQKSGFFSFFLNWFK